MASHQSAWYRRMWQQAADATGAVVHELGSGHLLIGRGGVETVVSGHRVMLDHPATLDLALDKVLVHRLLEAKGVPVPEHVEMPAFDLAAGAAFLARVSGECVVKPADGSGGGAVTPGLQSADDVWRAGMFASALSSHVLVERAVTGDEYRLLFLDGRLLDVVRRARPTVRGDGTSTVAELITEQNRRRLDDGGRSEVTRLLHVDLDCELTLRRQDLALRSVLAHGRQVAVKRAVSDNARVDNVTVRDLSVEVIEVATVAARESRLRLAGVDVVTPDRTRSLGDANGAVLEVNGTPGLHYHYHVAEPDQATPVAVPILDALLSAPRPRVQLPEPRRRNA